MDINRLAEEIKADKQPREITPRQLFNAFNFERRTSGNCFFVDCFLNDNSLMVEPHYNEVWIDGRLVIDNNDEVKRYSRRDNCLVLEAGLHPVEIGFLGHIIGGVPSNWDSAAIALRPEGATSFRNIPDDHFFREAD